MPSRQRLGECALAADRREQTPGEAADGERQRGGERRRQRERERDFESVGRDSGGAAASRAALAASTAAVRRWPWRSTGTLKVCRRPSRSTSIVDVLPIGASAISFSERARVSAIVWPLTDRMMSYWLDAGACRRSLAHAP